jgi:hypothetical protein
MLSWTADAVVASEPFADAVVVAGAAVDAFAA